MDEPDDWLLPAAVPLEPEVEAPPCVPPDEAAPGVSLVPPPDMPAADELPAAPAVPAPVVPGEVVAADPVVLPPGAVVPAVPGVPPPVVPADGAAAVLLVLLGAGDSVLPVCSDLRPQPVNATLNNAVTRTILDVLTMTFIFNPFTSTRPRSTRKNRLAYPRRPKNRNPKSLMNLMNPKTGNRRSFRMYRWNRKSDPTCGVRNRQPSCSMLQQPAILLMHSG